MRADIIVFRSSPCFRPGSRRRTKTHAVVRKPSVDVYAAPKLDAGKIAALKRDAAVAIAHAERVSGTRSTSARQDRIRRASTTCGSTTRARKRGGANRRT